MLVHYVSQSVNSVAGQVSLVGSVWRVVCGGWRGWAGNTGGRKKTNPGTNSILPSPPHLQAQLLFTPNPRTLLSSYKLSSMTITMVLPSPQSTPGQSFRPHDSKLCSRCLQQQQQPLAWSVSHLFVLKCAPLYLPALALWSQTLCSPAMVILKGSQEFLLSIMKESC